MVALLCHPAANRVHLGRHFDRCGAGRLLYLGGRLCHQFARLGGITFLAGFGEQEFTQRLRQLTKTIFGEAK
jgi:hypothetical protein